MDNSDFKKTDDKDRIKTITLIAQYYRQRMDLIILEPELLVNKQRMKELQKFNTWWFFLRLKFIGIFYYLIEIGSYFIFIFLTNKNWEKNPLQYLQDQSAEERILTREEAVALGTFGGDSMKSPA